MNTIRQQNGKNWREFLIEEDRLVITTHVQGTERKATIPYDVGLISESFDETVMSERVFFGKKIAILLGAGVVCMFASFPMFAEGEDNQAWILPAIILLGISIGLLITAAVKSQPKTIRALRMYLGNGQFYLYGRNEQDRTDAKSLVEKLFAAQKTYFRKKYLVFNEAQSEDQIKTRLSWLYEQKLIDHQELTQELQKLPRGNR